MQIQTEMSSYDFLNNIEELTKSGMTVELSSFTGDKGDQVYSCKIKSWDKYARTMNEHGKGYGSSAVLAFSKAYERLNKL